MKYFIRVIYTIFYVLLLTLSTGKAYSAVGSDLFRVMDQLSCYTINQKKRIKFKQNKNTLAWYYPDYPLASVSNDIMHCPVIQAKVLKKINNSQYLMRSDYVSFLAVKRYIIKNNKMYKITSGSYLYDDRYKIKDYARLFVLTFVNSRQSLDIGSHVSGIFTHIGTENKYPIYKLNYLFTNYK